MDVEIGFSDAWRLRMKMMGQDYTGSGFDLYTQCPLTTDDDGWRSFVQRYPRYTSFAKQPLQNEDKLRRLFQGRCATGERSVSAAMMSKSSEPPKRADVVLVDTEEGSGDSGEMHDHDQGNMDIFVGYESSLQTTETGKCKSDGDYDGYKRRHNQKIDKCLVVLNKVMSCEVQSSTPPAPPLPPPPQKSLYDKIYDKLREFDQVNMRGDIYIYHAMKTIMENHHEEFFLVLRTATMVEAYLDEHVDIAKVFAYMGINHRERLAASIIILHRLQTLLSTPKRLPMRVGGEDGGQFIRRMITSHPSLCRE
ncbi:hypothetical protein Cgig2_024519 [Carnegiea gigantea]|uniref:Uncharacterized protein n=1 Tax=Carnegiea gigantea TaxID=171969 RepID=A0A9Q1GHR4_9CARY|nr:hypothetical protein Cgig2_024519 [Carnegiea gigantea]